jgi:hypothetical protein
MVGRRGEGRRILYCIGESNTSWIQRSTRYHGIPFDHAIRPITKLFSAFHLLSIIGLPRIDKPATCAETKRCKRQPFQVRVMLTHRDRRWNDSDEVAALPSKHEANDNSFSVAMGQLAMRSKKRVGRDFSLSSIFKSKSTRPAENANSVVSSKAWRTPSLSWYLGTSMLTS